MSQIDNELKRVWTPGWHLDLEYQVPRVVFHKRTSSGNSTCYMYTSKDFEDHINTCGITTLEYLEGKSFYREHCIKLLKKRIEDRIPVDEQKIRNAAFHTYYSDDGFGGSQLTTIKGDK